MQLFPSTYKIIIHLSFSWLRTPTSTSSTCVNIWVLTKCQDRKQNITFHQCMFLFKSCQQNIMKRKNKLSHRTSQITCYAEKSRGGRKPQNWNSAKVKSPPFLKQTPESHFSLSFSLSVSVCAHSFHALRCLHYRQTRQRRHWLTWLYLTLN